MDLFCCCTKNNSDDECIGVKKNPSQTSVPIDEWILDLDSKETEASINTEESPESTKSVASLFKSIFHASLENRLALKLYGNKKGILTEQTRQDSACCSRWMIHPFSHFRWYWDLLMVFLLIFTVIVLPVSITFFGDKFDPKWLAINSIVDTLFFMDICINFRTGIVTADAIPDQVILDPKKVAKRYIKGWFFVDALSSIPFDYFTLIATQGSATVSPSLLKASRALRILRLAKMLSLLRLLRISRLLRYIQRWEDLFNLAGGFLRISKLITMMLLLAHWNGCVQFLVPMLQDVPDNSWISINRLQNASAMEQYSWSLFKAISHMLCIGFGRWPPQNVTEAWLTIVSMMVGATFYALFIGNMSTLLLSIDSPGRLYNEKVNQVEEYMRYRKIPQDIRQKILDYYEHRYQHKYFDEEQILNELSHGLREDITAHNCKDLVQSVSFFQNASPQFVSAVITKLKFEVFLKDEYIIRAGTKGDCMYFIQCGVVAVVLDDGQVATRLSDGSHFGEICLLTEDRRVANVVATTTTDLFSLSKENFNSLLEEFPDMEQALQAVALHRLSKIGKKASFQKSSVTARGRISTHIPPPPVVLSSLENNETVSREEMVITNEKDDSSTRKRKVCSSGLNVLSTPGDSRWKLPPLQITRGLKSTSQSSGEPSESNPHLIQYPSSSSDDEDSIL